MSQKIDLRIQKTQRLIRDTFITLLIEEGFENITIRHLCTRAHINRTTFYRHYSDKFDLATQLIQAFMTEPLAAIGDVLLRDPQAGWQHLFEHIAENATFYKAMLGAKGMPHFAEQVQKIVEEQMLSFFLSNGLKPENLHIPLALSIRYLAAAQIGLIKWWLENDQPVSADQAAGYLVNLHLHGGMKAFMGA